MFDKKQWAISFETAHFLFLKKTLFLNDFIFENYFIAPLFQLIRSVKNKKSSKLSLTAFTNSK